jgi:hypothetical protein
LAAVVLKPVPVMMTVVLPASPVGPLFGLNEVITGAAEILQMLTNTQLNATIYFNILLFIKTVLNYVIVVFLLQYAFVIINLKRFNSSSRLFAQESKLFYRAFNFFRAYIFSSVPAWYSYASAFIYFASASFSCASA